MTTGKYELVIKWASGQSTICGEMTDHQHGEMCRILSPAYRAQLPSQGGEAVEVVAYRYTSSQRLGGKWHYQESFPKWDDRKVRELGQMDELMTVAQHQRIMAATHPADQVAEPDAELVELLRDAADYLRGLSLPAPLVTRIDAKLSSLEVKQ